MASVSGNDLKVGAKRRTILFGSSNGVGLGHVTRQLAVANRLPDHDQPVFLTMSHAVELIRAQSYPVLHVSHHRSSGLPTDEWNIELEKEYRLAFKSLRPDVFVYDATAVFGGVVESMADFPDIPSVWIRRAMWRSMHASFLELSDRFSIVIEPGELAAELDDGPTAKSRSDVVVVPPVLHLEPAQRMTRKAARHVLALPDDARVVCVQLGSGVEFDLTMLRDTVIDRILSNQDTIVVEIRSPLAPPRSEPTVNDERHRVITLYPAYSVSTAFDAAVSLAGYNSFHENVLGGLPTLFVPNEAPFMDRQIIRARWAEMLGCGRLARRDDDPMRLLEQIDAILDGGRAAGMREACGRIEWRNGADDIVKQIGAM